MAFNYRGRDAGGKIVSGIIEVHSREQAVQELRRRGIFITFCREAIVSPTRRRWHFRRGVSLRDLALFSRQLATMLEAGLPIVSALNILHKQATNHSLQQSIVVICRDLENGESFSGSLARHPNIFPDVFIHTVEAGEMGGALDGILYHLAGYLEREHEVEEKVKSALAYPAVVSGVALLTVIFLLYYVLPIFEAMLLSLQVPLPWPTRLVLGISGLLQRLWPFLALIMVGAGYGLYCWKRKPQGRFQIDSLLLRLPIFGPLRHKAILSRFSRTLGTLLHCGVPLMASLEVVRRTAGNVVVAEAVGRARVSVREGRSLAEPLAASGLFPPMVVEMITVGEATGNLDTLLTKISSFYDQEVGETVGRLSTIIEPVLIIFVGGIVGLIIISVLMPVFTVYSGIQ